MGWAGREAFEVEMIAPLLVLLFVRRTLPWLVRRHRLLFRGQLCPPLGGLVRLAPGVVEDCQVRGLPRNLTLFPDTLKLARSDSYTQLQTRSLGGPLDDRFGSGNRIYPQQRESADLSVTIARFAQLTWMKTIRSALTSLQLGYETEPRGNGIRRVAG